MVPFSNATPTPGFKISGLKPKAYARLHRAGWASGNTVPYGSKAALCRASMAVSLGDIGLYGTRLPMPLGSSTEAAERLLSFPPISAP